jgi:protein-S-isoprenylcysteine O-methyltransferase Ste14
MTESVRTVDFRQRLFQSRSYTPIPFLIVMVIFAHPTLTSLAIGAATVIVGEFLRLWGVSIAGSETRTTGPVGGTYLVTHGPFGIVRNPLYLGNMLLYFGVGIMSMALFPWLQIGAVLFFLFQYSMIVSLEEEYLLKTFGADYVRYAEAVPRFVPTVRRYAGGSHQQPTLDWKRGVRSERRTLQAIAIVSLMLVVLWQVRN